MERFSKKELRTAMAYRVSYKIYEDKSFLF